MDIVHVFTGNYYSTGYECGLFIRSHLAANNYFPGVHSVAIYNKLYEIYSIW